VLPAPGDLLVVVGPGRQVTERRESRQEEDPLGLQVRLDPLTALSEPLERLRSGVHALLLDTTPAARET